jgi:hypothetical protein
MLLSGFHIIFILARKEHLFSQKHKLFYITDGFGDVCGFLWAKSTHVSTWVELMELMSWAAFFNLTFTGTCQWVFG